jgi:hypothetical protein
MPSFVNQSGEPLEDDDGPPFGDAELAVVSLELIIKNEASTFTKRSLALTLHGCVGRGIEPSNISYRLMKWISRLGVVSFSWFQQKQLNAKYVTIHAHKDSMLLCVLHGIACHLIVGGGKNQYDPDGEQYLYPSTRISEGNRAQQITDILRDPTIAAAAEKRDPCYPRWNKDVTQKALRQDGIQTMLEHPKLSEGNANARSGHENGNIYAYVATQGPKSARR